MMDKIENYIQTDLVSIVNKLKNQDNLIDEIDFFGNTKLHASSTFKFRIGERMQLKEIASFVKTIIDGGHTNQHLQQPQKKIDYIGTKFYPNHGRFFSNITESFVLESKINPDINDLKSKLFNDTFKLFESMNVQNEILQIFDKNMISVEIDSNNHIIGTVNCVLCKENKKKRKSSQFAIVSKPEGDQVYWIFSNFIKHIKRMHMELIKIDAKKRRQLKGSKSIAITEQNKIWCWKSKSSDKK